MGGFGGGLRAKSDPNTNFGEFWAAVMGFRDRHYRKPPALAFEEPGFGKKNYFKAPGKNSTCARRSLPFPVPFPAYCF